MEIILSAEIMKRVMENCSHTPITFLSDKRSKDIAKGITIMENMGVRKIEIDLSEDSENLLH